MTSEDVIHDVFVPAFRVKADVDPRPLHAHLVPADQARPLSPVLRRVLRHAAFRDDRPGRRHGAERVPGVAERRRGRKARWRRRAASCSRISPATPAIAPTRRAAARCSRGCSARPSRSQSGETVDRRRSLHPRVDPEPGAKITAGFQPIMPTFQGLVTEEQLLRADRVRQVAERTRRRRRPRPGPPGETRRRGARHR